MNEKEFAEKADEVFSLYANVYDSVALSLTEILESGNSSFLKLHCLKISAHLNAALQIQARLDAGAAQA